MDVTGITDGRIAEAPRPRCAFLVEGDNTSRECGIVARCYYVKADGKDPRYWLCHRHDSARAMDLAAELGLFRYEIPDWRIS